jgi:hypothetical protein
LSSIVSVTKTDAKAIRPFTPFSGFTRLPRRGVIVWSTVLGRAGSPTEFRHIAWPPRLRTFRLDRAWEGQPAPNIQQRLTFGAVRGWNIDVRVYFATQHPDKALLDKTQAELNRLELPPRHA